MAEENKSQTQSQSPAQQRATTQGQKTVKAELIAKTWMERQEDGSFKRHNQGDQVEVSKELFDKLGDEGGHFKPSFRRVSQDQD